MANTIIQKFFGTRKKTVMSVAAVAAAVALLGAGTAYAASGARTAAAKDSAISEEAAQNYAFADAGVDPASALYVRAEFDHEDGQFIYEVDFTAGDTEYEYWILASDGTVIKKSAEIIALATAAETTEITLEEAKVIALEDAGLSAENVTFTKADLDHDDGLTIYDIEFYAENVEYEYEINVNSGAIYSKSKETHAVEAAAEEPAAGKSVTEDASTVKTEAAVVETVETTTQVTSGASSGNDSSSSGTTTTSGSTTLESAKSIALSDAGVSASDVTFKKAHEDYDDGVAVYDIEFYSSTAEYEYEIRVSDGAIVDKSIEALEIVSGSSSNAGSSGSADSSSYISVDEAKAIALNRAGLSASDVVFEKAKLEKDDGIMEYEIEFYQGNMEYECTINAITGAIIEYDAEWDD
ncbi:MAG: PepSY domain-containing protein [Lachnospiraceae bacterium]|nr:PepSY domain-containing protein [Lachnospiraceae bacterium]